MSKNHEGSMKDLVQEAVEKHKEYVEANNKWRIARKTLEKSLKKFAEDKTKELEVKYSLKLHKDTFIIGLDSGSATPDWKLEAGFLSTIRISDNVWYEPLEGGLWVKYSYDTQKNMMDAKETKDGPIPLNELKEFLAKMSGECGAEFKIYEWVINERQKLRYGKYTDINGKVFVATEEDEGESYCD